MGIVVIRWDGIFTFPIPVATTVGYKGEGEWSLAAKLLDRLPKASPLVVDRLYGCGKSLQALVATCQSADSALPVRVRGNIKRRKVKPLGDGSAKASINLLRQGGGRPVDGTGGIRGTTRCRYEAGDGQTGEAPDPAGSHPGATSAK